MSDWLVVHCSEFNVPMEVPGEHLEEALLQNPMIADFLDQAKANGRDAIYKARMLVQVHSAPPVGCGACMRGTRGCFWAAPQQLHASVLCLAGRL